MSDRKLLETIAEDVKAVKKAQEDERLTMSGLQIAINEHDQLFIRHRHRLNDHQARIESLEARLNHLQGKIPRHGRPRKN